MSSTLLSALANLDESVRVLEGCLDRLGAGLEVSKDQFNQKLMEARRNADAVRELVRAKSPDVDWTDRQALEKVLRDLEAAEAGRKELQLRRLLELAEELNAGTITHRLKSRVTALEELREAAVGELLAEAAQDQSKDLPGPDALAWIPWACGAQGNANAAQFSELEEDFPALVRFATEMEESYWQPRTSSHEMPEQVAVAEISYRQEPKESPTLQLSELPPALAAVYDELFPTKPSQIQGSAPTVPVARAAAQASEVQAFESLRAAPADSNSDATQLRAESDSTSRDNGSGSKKRSPQTTIEAPTAPAAPAPVEPIPITFGSFAAADAESVEEHKDSRFGLNRSVLFTVGAIAIIVLVMVVISAVSGNLTGKRGSSPPATVASDSAKEGSAASSEAPVSDIELVGQIEQRLKAIKGSSIYVTVQHGTAILEGQVPSEEALATAEDLTLQSKQIKIVRNRIQIAKAGALRSTNRPTALNPASAE